MDLYTCNISTEEEYIKSLDEDSAMLIVHNLGYDGYITKFKYFK